jgi:Cof subfamily protein (haloacid dehalogenase superfamily)
LKPPCKLLAVDIDGTLVGRDGVISAENREALALAAASGIRVCLCTGRSVRSSVRYTEELSLDSYHIFYDGALVTNPHTGEDLVARSIDAALVDEMVACAGEMDIYMEVSSGVRSFSGREVAIPDFKRRFFDAEHTVADLAGIGDREVIVQGELVATGPGADERADRFISRFAERLQVGRAKIPTYPDVTFIITLARGACKGAALEALTARLGITRGETAAIGDWVNDVSMLGAAGLGIAMGNACDELKKVADHVTRGVDEHGLAAAIKELIL